MFTGSGSLSPTEWTGIGCQLRELSKRLPAVGGNIPLNSACALSRARSEAEEWMETQKKRSESNCVQKKRSQPPCDQIPRRGMCQHNAAEGTVRVHAFAAFPAASTDSSPGASNSHLTTMTVALSPIPAGLTPLSVNLISTDRKCLPRMASVWEPCRHASKWHAQNEVSSPPPAPDVGQMNPVANNRRQLQMRGGVHIEFPSFEKKRESTIEIEDFPANTPSKDSSSWKELQGKRRIQDPIRRNNNNFILLAASKYLPARCEMASHEIG
jgi:hypothetical protein